MAASMSEVSVSSTTAASGPTLTITTPYYLVALCAIFFLTACNGLYNALDMEYQGKHSTFLFTPKDRHADLIEAGLSFPPFEGEYLPGRDDYYVGYYVHDFFKRQAADGNELTLLHYNPPLIALMYLLLKRTIISLGSVEMVYLFYFTAVTCTAYLALRFRRSFFGALLAFLALTYSYPFLMILCRGNPGALLTTMCLIFFIHELLVGKRVILCAMLLAIAFNCRPNVILLAPLLLIFGWRDCIRACVIFGAAAVAIFALSYFVAIRMYPGYDLTIFQKALHVYYLKYVIGHMGVFYNNSAYGAAWCLIKQLHLPGGVTTRTLQFVQLSISVISALLILAFTFLYMRRRIEKYEYAFTLSALYILGSTIMATYHLFFLFIFILILAIRPLAPGSMRLQWIILATSVLVLAPKNYFFRHDISFEVIINPVLLTIALYLIYRERAKSALAGGFWKSLRWNGD